MLNRRTKIIATIGPASWSPKQLDGLIAAGMNMARLNFSHGDTESHRRILKRVRAASKRARRPIGILVDMPGPKFRVGTLPDGGIELERGAEIMLDSRAKTWRAEDARLPLRAPGIFEGVAKGERLLLDDGHIELEIVSTEGSRIRAIVQRGGKLTSNKGVNVPGQIRVKTRLTDRDRLALEFAASERADVIALSFVRSAEDIQRVKRFLAKRGAEDIPLIAKLEKPQAIDNLPGILAEVQAVMVARGDLGVEVPYEQVPLIQKHVIEAAHYQRIPVIVATQMLHSMTEHLQPTRAEVSDVSGAAFDRADAVMLSAETATGVHPAEAVRAMARIVSAAESRAYPEIIDLLKKDKSWTVGRRSRAITSTAAVLADRMGASAIVVVTSSGGSAWLVSTTHPKVPIYAFTPDVEVGRRMTFLYGVLPALSPRFKRTGDVIRYLDKALPTMGLCHKGDNVVVVSGTPYGVSGSTNTLRIHRIGEGTY